MKHLKKRENLSGKDFRTKSRFLIQYPPQPPAGTLPRHSPHHMPPDSCACSRHILYFYLDTSKPCTSPSRFTQHPKHFQNPLLTPLIIRTLLPDTLPVLPREPTPYLFRRFHLASKILRREFHRSNSRRKRIPLAAPRPAKLPDGF